MTLRRKSQDAQTWIRRAQEILRIESQAVLRQLRHVTADFMRAVRLVAKCRGRVIVMGIGKSGLIGRKLAATLSSTGTPSFFVHPTESLHGDSGMLAVGDVVLVLSYSGETEELQPILNHLTARKLPLIAMTGRTGSRLGRAADIILNAAVAREACPYNVTPTSSTTAMLALGDALALVVMEMKGFKKEDFARLHPGGALGKRLTMRVTDLMHKGRENPVVSESKKVGQALKVMTQTRMGAASVVDARGRLIGVFTDGDLRRCLQKDVMLLDRPLKSVMTRMPRSLKPEMLASEASVLFRQYGVDNFPVIDQRRRPVGILDEKDLLDEGLL